MGFWLRATGAGLRGSARAGRSASQSVAQAHATRQAKQLPRRVAQRGYLVAGDAPPPPGLDLPDYRGCLSLQEVAQASARSGVVVPVGATLDLATRTLGPAFSLPLEQFFQHMVVVAPPGKGKTYGLLAPLATRLLRAGATVIALDITGDMSEQIKSFARETPEAASVSVSWKHWSIHPHHGQHSWNPLANVDPNDSLAIEGIKAAIVGDDPVDRNHKIFHERDRRVLGGLLKLLLTSDPAPTLSKLADLASDHRRVASLAGQHPHLRSSVQDLVDDPSDLWSLANQLEPYLDPAVKQATERSELDLEEVVQRQSLVIVGAELELRERSKVAASLFVNRLMSVLQGRYGRTDGVPVVLLIDEAPQIAERIGLDRILATARATRTGVVFAAQNVTQFGDERAASTLLDSCDSMMLLPGASEATVKAFQSRLGQRYVERVSFGQDLVGWNRNARTETSGERVAMVGARELMDPPFGGRPAFLHSRTLGGQPAVLDLTRGVLDR